MTGKGSIKAGAPQPLPAIPEAPPPVAPKAPAPTKAAAKPEAPADGVDQNVPGQAAAPKAKADGLGTGKVSEEARLAADLADLTHGFTNEAAEKRIAAGFLTYVEGDGRLSPEQKKERAQKLLAELDKRGISYGRLVDEVEDPAARRTFLSATLPLVTTDQKADAIEHLTGNWLWQLLKLLFSFAHERAAVSQIVNASVDPANPQATNTELSALLASCRRRGIDFETLFDQLPNDPKIRESFVRTVAPSLTLDERATAIAMLCRGYTPADKERAIAVLLETTPKQQRTELLTLVSQKEKISYSNLEGELESASDRQSLISGFLRPSKLALFTSAGLPTTEAEFAALRAAPDFTALEALRGALDTLPGTDIGESARVLATAGGDVSERGAALSRIGDKHQSSISELDAAVVAGTADMARIDAKIAAYKTRIATATELLSYTGEQRELVVGDAQGIISFFTQQIELLEQEKARVSAATVEAKAALAVARTVGTETLTLSSTTQTLLEGYKDLHAEREAMRTGRAPVDKTKFYDTSTLVTYAASLSTHTEALAKKKVALLELEQTDPAGFAAVKDSGLLDLIDADLGAIKAQATYAAEDFVRLEGERRFDAELTGQRAMGDGITLVSQSDKQFATGTDAQLDAQAKLYPAKIAAVDAALTKLTTDRKAALKTIRTLEGKSPISVAEQFQLTSAKITIAGATKRKDGRGTVSLDDQIGALQETKIQLEQSHAMITGRRENLRAALSGRLTALGLAPVFGTDDAALFAGAKRLADALGLPAPAAPTSGIFAHSADPLSALMKSATERQFAMYAMSAQLLRQQFGVEIPGATWTKDTTPPSVAMPMTGTPPQVDWKTFDAQLKASQALLAQALGMSGMDPESTLFISKMTTLGPKDSIDSLGKSAFMDAYKDLLTSRAFIDSRGVSELAAWGRTKGSISLADLRRLSTDLTQPIGLREAARTILANPELLRALEMGANADTTASRLDALATRLGKIEMPTGENTPPIVGKAILQMFYADAEKDAARLHAIFKASGSDATRLGMLESLLKDMPADHRKQILVEYGAKYGTAAFGKNLQEAFDGAELGWALVYLEGERVDERAAAIREHLTFEYEEGKTWPEGKVFGALAGKPMTQADYEDWSFELKQSSSRSSQELYDKTFDKILYSTHGTQPPAELRSKFGALITKADAVWAEYKAARNSGQTELAKQKKDEVARILAEAGHVEHLMSQGSQKATDKAIESWGTVMQISKTVAIVAGATAITLATLGTGAPAAVGGGGAAIAAGGTATATTAITWGSVATAVAWGTGGGTVIAFTLAVGGEWQAKGFDNIDWSKVKAETRDGAGTAFISALTAGIPIASMAKIGVLAKTSRAAFVIENSFALKTATVSGIMSVTTGVGTVGDAALHYVTGDKKGAEERIAELPVTMTRAFFGGIMLGPISGRFNGAWGRVVDGLAGAGENTLFNAIRGKPLTEGLAQAVVNSVVIGGIFEAHHAKQAITTIKAKPGLEEIPVRIPGEKITTEPTWKIIKVDEGSAQVVVQKGAVTKKIPVLDFAKVNPRLVQAEDTNPNKPPPKQDDAPPAPVTDKPPPPAGLESGVIQGMGNTTDAKRVTIGAVEKAMQTGGEVSLVSFEAHRFKEWGNVNGDHQIGNAYIGAMGKGLEAYLARAGFPEAHVFHKGGKSFKLLYDGPNQRGFEDAIAALARQGDPAAIAFKKDVLARVKTEVPTASHKYLKGIEELNYNLGLAKAPKAGETATAFKVAEKLFEQSFEASKLAQLGSEPTIAAAKAARKDGFAIFDEAAASALKGKSPAHLNEMTDFGGAFTRVDEALARVGDPAKLPAELRNELYLSGDVGRTASGRLVIKGRHMADYYTRELLSGVKAGKLEAPVDLLIVEGGDELRIIKVTKENGELVLRTFAIDINDFGAANGIVRQTADGTPIPGPRSADEIFARVLAEMDAALSKPGDVSANLAEANAKIYSDLGKTSEFAITGKVSPDAVKGFKAGAREAGNFKVGAEGSVTLGGVAYKARVSTANESGGGEMILTRTDGKEPKQITVKFTTEAAGKGFKLTLLAPNVRTSLTIAGITVRASDLEVVMVNGKEVTRLKEEIVGKGFYKKDPAPDLDHFLAVLSDRRAELQKHAGKSAALTSGSGQYNPKGFVGEVSIRDLATHPSTKIAFKSLLKEHYVRGNKARVLPDEHRAVADAHLRELEAQAWMGKLVDEYRQQGIADPAARLAAPGEIARLTGLDVLTAKDVTLSQDSLAPAGQEGSTADVVGATLGGKDIAVKRYLADPNGTPPIQKTDYDRFMREAKGAKLLSDLGIGPKFYGIVDLGDGRLAFAMDKVTGAQPESMSAVITDKSVRQLREGIEALQAAGYDVADFQYMITPEGDVRIIDAGGIRPASATKSHPHLNLQKEMIMIRLYGEGEPHRMQLPPGNMKAEITSKLEWTKQLSPEQLAFVSRKTETMPSHSRLTVSTDAQGNVKFIENYTFSDGSFQTITHTADKSGTVTNVVTERFAVNGERIASAFGDHLVVLKDVRELLPPMPTAPANVMRPRTGRSIDDIASRIDNTIAHHLDAGDITAVLAERTGRKFPKGNGKYWDHISEMVSSRNAFKKAITSLESYLTNPKLDAESRAYAEALLTRAQAAYEVCDATLNGKTPPLLDLGPDAPTQTPGRFNMGPSDPTLIGVETILAPTPKDPGPDAPTVKGPGPDTPTVKAPVAETPTVKGPTATSSAAQKAEAALAAVAVDPRMADAAKLDSPGAVRAGLEAYYASEGTKALDTALRDVSQHPAELAFVTEFKAGLNPAKFPESLPPGEQPMQQGGGVSSDVTTFIAGDKSRKFFKEIGQRNRTKPLNEIATYDLSAAMGLDLVAPIRLGKVGGKVGAVIDIVPSNFRRLSPYELKDVLVSPKYADGLSDLRAFDYLTGSLDRHPKGNVWVDEQSGKFMVIDHEDAFTGGIVPHSMPNMRPISGGFLPKTYTARYIEAFKKLSPATIREQFSGKLSDAKIELIVARYYVQRADIMAKHPGALPQGAQ